MLAVTEIKDENVRPARTPTRTCVGCGEKAAPDALVRLVAGPSEEAGLDVAVDMADGMFGRGAHVHAAPDCLAKACKGGLARSFKAKVKASPGGLADGIVAGADRRIAGLLGGAKRAKRLAIGADAVKQALAAGAPLIVVARDAGSVAGRMDIVEAVAEGRAVAVLDRATLGVLFGRAEVAVAAVLDEGIAGEIKRVYSMADSVRATRGRLEV